MHFALGPPPVMPSGDVQQTRKRKLEDIDEGGSNGGDARKAVEIEDGIVVSTEKADKPGSTNTNTTDEDRVLSLTSSFTTSETTLSSAQEEDRARRLKRRLMSAYAGEETLPTASINIETTSPTNILKTLNLLVPPPPQSASSAVDTPFLIPPLKSFNAIVRLRNLQLSLRTRPDTAKAEYYASLYTRLTDHLTDVFLDNGQRYRVVEDIPSLGPKPKLKVRDDEKMLVGIEKRGILYLKD